MLRLVAIHMFGKVFHSAHEMDRLVERDAQVVVSGGNPPGAGQKQADHQDRRSFFQEWNGAGNPTTRRFPFWLRRPDARS